MDFAQTKTIMKRTTTTRFRFCGNRKSGVVKSIVAMNPMMTNFFRPIIIHETGGSNDNAGYGQ